jgi:carbon-monoxide dehydrogenase medium subunit
MKPAPFAYVAPTSVDEALALLAQHADEAKPLAGGQSLVPLMNFRLARPGVLVDLNRIPELQYIREHDGGLAIGAMTRQRAAERSALVRERCPLLAAALPLVGHPPIRNRGTVGGSLAHADPAAELPAVAAALDAELVVRGPSGERVARPDAFFLTYLTTTLEPTELLVEVRFPAWPAGAGWAFEELSRRHGDFAIVGVAAVLQLDSQGQVADARLAFIGAAPTPVRAHAAEAALRGQPATAETFRAAAERVVDALDPSDDVHASAAYRREVAKVLARRALVAAHERARPAS